ncbi:MAG TPA: IclR family transcriptional regulator [Steroidobacteraceae bacterium]|jgi:DNA-binding IclR family transcriptional regulator
MPQVIEAVVTTLNIIEHMAQARGPVGISELAQAVCMPKPRIYRHLRTLLSRGYVAQEPLSEKYGLTMRLSHIGRAIADQTGVQVEMRSVMPALRARVHQSVVVGQIEDDGVRVLDILRQPSAVEISSRPGTLFDFHCTAQGKVALAFGPPKLWKRVQRAPLRRYTDATHTDIARLKAEVDKVRKRGWAVAPGEVLSGINALAAPVFDAAGALVATIGVLGSVQHLAPRPAPALVAAVLEAANDFSRRLGYREAAAS